MISREEVLKLLEYDPVTGIFRWKISHANNVKAGVEAGRIAVSTAGKAYLQIGINYRRYYAHRLAWLIITGNFPEHDIDHIDGNGTNNAAANLREVRHVENCKNQRRPVNNKSGAVGVYWHKTASKWMAQIRLNGKNKHLGRFESFDDALAARKNAERIYDFHPRHGEIRPL